MEQTHIIVHRVRGIIGLPVDGRAYLIGQLGAVASAFLTVERDPYFLHLRRLKAFGETCAQVFLSGSGLIERERFERALAVCVIPEGIDFDKPLLIVEVREQVTRFHSDRASDVGEISLGIDCLETQNLARSGEILLEAATAGISLALPSSTSPVATRLGHATYVTDPQTGRLTYTLDMSASSSSWSMTSVSQELLAQAASMATALWTKSDLKTVSHLLSRSIRTTDDPQAFLTAWAGLEVLISKSFKSTYEQRIYEALSVATSSDQFLRRVRDVMKDKYRVADKFAVMCSFLDPTESETDIKSFMEIKADRDGIHEMKLGASGYPTSRTQRLLMKYLRLHLLVTTGQSK